MVFKVGVQVRNGRHETPLFQASDDGHVDVARFLIENQADVNSISNGGWTSLHSASRHGHADVVQLLLDNGADANIRGEYLCTPLHLASARGYPALKAMEFLIEHGARIDVLDENQRTLLGLASEHGELETANLLIKSGSNVNSQDAMGWTPSHTAAWNGHLSLLELLLDSGADVDMRNNSEKTPSDLAQENGKLEVASFLARRSGNICALEIVGSAQLKAGSQEILPEEIVEQHMDGNPSPDGEESDSLHYASRYGRVDATRRLLDGGADVNKRNEYFQTPLDMVSQHGTLEIAKTLIIYRADVNSRDNFGWTPLLGAVKYEHIDVMELLLDNGADIHTRSGRVLQHCTSHRAVVTSKLCGHSSNTEQMCKYGMCMEERPMNMQYSLDTGMLRSF
jgi:ankyrin repeat protein